MLLWRRIKQKKCLDVLGIWQKLFLEKLKLARDLYVFIKKQKLLYKSLLRRKIHSFYRKNITFYDVLLKQRCQYIFAFVSRCSSFTHSIRLITHRANVSFIKTYVFKIIFSYCILQTM